MIGNKAKYSNGILTRGIMRFFSSYEDENKDVLVAASREDKQQRLRKERRNTKIAITREQDFNAGVITRIFVIACSGAVRVENAVDG